MSPGASIRLAGFLSLLAVDGESLVVEYADPAQSIKSLVKRNLNQSDLSKLAKAGAVDFSPSGMTMLEFPQSTLTPVAGLSFIDGVSVRHRVRYTLRTDITWQCYCQISNVL